MPIDRAIRNCELRPRENQNKNCRNASRHDHYYRNRSRILRHVCVIIFTVIVCRLCDSNLARDYKNVYLSLPLKTTVCKVQTNLRFSIDLFKIGSILLSLEL